MNKNCSYTKDHIWDYHSGLFSRREETDMQEHILSCKACREMLAELRGLDQILSDAILQREDDENENTTDDTTIAASTHPSGTKRKYLLIAIVAAVAAIILIIYIILPSKHSGYPIEEDNGDVFGHGDSTAVDSLHIEPAKIDTLSLEQLRSLGLDE